LCHAVKEKPTRTISILFSEKNYLCGKNISEHATSLVQQINELINSPQKNDRIFRNFTAAKNCIHSRASAENGNFIILAITNIFFN
jgi:hypothetical protein